MRGTLLALLVLCGAAWAEEACSDAAIPMTLEQAVQMALVNNGQLEVEEYNPDIQRTAIDEALADFDLTFFSNGKGGQTTSGSASFLSGLFGGGGFSQQHDLEMRFGLKKRWIIGTETELSTGWNRQKTNSFFATLNPSYNSDLTFTVKQPLLRDAGIAYNGAKIKSARNEVDIAQYEVEKQEIEVVAKLEEVYFDLVAAMRDREIRLGALALAKELRDVNEERVQLGTAEPIVVLQAEAAMASQRELVLRAENGIGNAQDRLRKALQPIDPVQRWDHPIAPLDGLPTGVDLGDPDAYASHVLRSRPDYLKLRKQVENKLISVREAENQLLPKADVNGTLKMTGLDGNLGNSYDVLFRGDTYEWEVGFEFEYPIGNRAGRSRLRKAKLELEQARKKVRSLERDISVEVAEASREVGNARERIAASQKEVELRQKKLHDERDKFDLGISTTQNVLESQRELADAMAKELQAEVDFTKAFVKLRKAMGLTLVGACGQ